MKIISLALAFSLLSLVVSLNEMANGKNRRYVYKYHYRTKKGDTLSKVSRRFMEPVNKIARENGIKNPRSLRVGQKLVVTKRFPVYFEGVTSWYGGFFHGRKTANGETYNMYELSAAHRTLPFGTEILVENPKNGRKLRLRINDRGPYIKGRVLDLSFGAAKELGLVREGKALVYIKIIHLGG